MTREEIKYASKDYVNYLLDKQEYHNENYTEYDIREAFEKGAMFANNNPDISSFWHDASKEPKNGKTILLFYGSDFPSLLHKRATLRKWKEYVNGMKVIRWAYVEDLVPNT